MWVTYIRGEPVFTGLVSGMGLGECYVCKGAGAIPTATITKYPRKI